MNDVTVMLRRIDEGDPTATNQLLQLLYEELRKLAAARMADEAPDHTLQATALVHEAYARLIHGQSDGWESRGHFFAAAAEAMRRILIDHARRRQAQKRRRTASSPDLERLTAALPVTVDEMLDFDQAITRLEAVDPQAARIVSLRVFAGLSVEEAAASIGVPVRSAYRDWAFAKAWLFRELGLASQ
ncbi:MAG: sigma-70 family RNA polymerase sigma factor [Planctomycetaceae bacterium]|nr:sigma-70 family RNA polymerase sigma factor [Planctomycetaceae bacterium]